jgi:hypothetical protein
MPKDNYTRYLNNEIVDIIHSLFPDEGYPVQQHENNFKEAVTLLKNPTEQNQNKAKFAITQSILNSFTPDSVARPKFETAEILASTIVSEILSKPKKVLNLEKVI